MLEAAPRTAQIPERTAGTEQLYTEKLYWDGGHGTYPDVPGSTTAPLPAAWLARAEAQEPVLAAGRDGESPSRGGRHRRPPDGMVATLASHRARFAAFSAVGGAVFAMGLGLQWLLVARWHFGSVSSFVLQGFVSVQASFLLNHYWTWRDQHVPFWQAWYKFNAQKVITTVANTAVYFALVRLGVNYLIANIATTAVFTVVNYVGGHYWVFKTKPKDAEVLPAFGPAGRVVGGLPADWPYARDEIPTVSVVVPCKGNERTIRATVDALLGQSYPALAEVILVGSAGDSTWQALDGIADPRLVILEQEPTPGLRDPNVKRDKGIRHARGDLLALADSDIVMHPDWLATGIGLLATTGTHCVTGGMKSIHDSFWGHFVDGTRMGAKTPRTAEPYVVTADNFGRHNRKPPVTANVIFTRRLYADCPLDIHWSYGYEDYEWFWRVTRGGYDIQFSNELDGLHHHRRGLRPLCREYLRSSDGCAKFVRAHPDSPLARKRWRQMVLLPLTALATAAAAVAAAVAAGQVVPVLEATALLTAAAAITAAAWEFAHQRAVAALTYPALNVLFGTLFVFGMLKGTIQAAPARVTARTTMAAEVSQ
jgi:putative flippase GtrA